MVFALGPLRLTGWRAAVAMAVVIALLVALIRYIAPAHPTGESRWDSIRNNWPISVSTLLWVVFSVYWSIAARNASAAKSAESSGSRQFHLLLLNGSLLLLLIPVPGLRARFLPDSPAVIAIGLTVQSAFLALALVARQHLGRNWSGDVTVKVDHALVRSGPYRRIRHPIYTAMIGMYLGTALVSGQTHALLAVAIIVAAYWRKIGLEETALRGEFGTAFDEYRRESWALFPGIW